MKILPKLAMLLEVNQDSFLPASIIDDEITSAHIGKLRLSA
jgi:hypothetical protein